MADTAVVGIIVAGTVGLLGPVLGYVAAARSDRRRIAHERELKAIDVKHERELKASDDLVALLDDVQIALDRLEQACADLRVGFMILERRDVLSFDRLDREKFDPRIVEANRARQDVRALIARLRMRPHANPELVNRVEAAEKALGDALNHMQFARGVIELDPQEEAAARKALSKVPGLLDRGREEARAYERLAREAVGHLIGPEGPSRIAVKAASQNRRPSERAQFSPGRSGIPGCLAPLPAMSVGCAHDYVG